LSCSITLRVAADGKGRHVDGGQGRESHHMGIMTHSFHNLWRMEDQNTEEWQGPRKSAVPKAQILGSWELSYMLRMTKKYFKLCWKQDKQAGKEHHC
jgi:hypothetical protein